MVRTTPTLKRMLNEKADAVPEPSGPALEAPFYIPATESATRSRHTLKHGDGFIVVDSHGDIGASAGGPDGFFYRDTRHLSHFEMLINGMQPLLLGSNLADDNALLSVDLANPDIYYDNRVILQKNLLHICRTVFLSKAHLFHRFAIRNYGSYRVVLLLSLTFDADFADIFEVRGAHRPRRGSVRSSLGHDRAEFIYRGLDDRTRHTVITFEPEPTHLSASLASFRVDLEPGKTMTVFGVASADGMESRPAFLRSLRHAHRDLKEVIRGGTSIETSNHVFNGILRRASADLAMLITQTPEGPYPYAGIPWYSTTFGRDGLITALECLWIDSRMPLGVLRRLAAYQAEEVRSEADAQPGKILHEMRAGEMANLGEVPFGLYYGSVDSTPLFVVLAGRYAQVTGDLEALASLWPAILRALAWINGPGDPDRDGFVEYARANTRGLENQGWKDSRDAIFHADGRLAKGPIALAEVQAYVHAGKKLAAWCARKLGDAERAVELDAAADSLAQRFEEAFWCEDLGTYALALDGDKKPCRVATSNAGQVLFGGMVRRDRAMAIAKQLTEPDFFSGWGVRTVSASEARYNPMSYHNGSVWPHDNAIIAVGLARYGATAAAARIFEGMFDAATYMDLGRLPELFCGFPRVRNRGPTLYPVACAPQAWASGAFFALLEASLGIETDPWKHEIAFRSPALPGFLDEVVLRDLKCGAASVDVALWRHSGDKISVQILKSRGDVEVNVHLCG
jgi:glycogen debranching enzyme